MSYRPYPYFATGMVLANDEMDALLAKILGHPIEDIADDPFFAAEEAQSVLGEYSAIYTGHNSDNAECFSIYTIKESGSARELDGYILVVLAEKAPKLYGASYKTKEELIDEFKNKLSRYLPDDFDYEDHIGHVIGVQWG